MNSATPQAKKAEQHEGGSQNSKQFIFWMWGKRRYRASKKHKPWPYSVFWSGELNCL